LPCVRVLVLNCFVLFHKRFRCCFEFFFAVMRLVSHRFVLFRNEFCNDFSCFATKRNNTKQTLYFATMRKKFRISFASFRIDAKLSGAPYLHARLSNNARNKIFGFPYESLKNFVNFQVISNKFP